MPTIVFRNDDESSTTRSSSDHSSFLDEEEAIYHDVLRDPEEQSFSSSEFQNEEKEAITDYHVQRRTKRYALIGVALILAALVIVIPVVMVTKSEDSKKKNEVTSGPMIAVDTSPDVSVPAPTEPVVPVPADDSSETEEEDPGPAEAEDDDDQEPTFNIDGETEATDVGRGEDDVLEDLFQPPLDVPSSLQGFSEAVLQPYTSREALEQDISVAAMELVERVLAYNIEMVNQYQSEMYYKDANDNKDKKQRINQREADVDEADTVQEDGTYVYAAYGNYLVVWNRSDGTLTASEQMPTPVGNSNTPHIQAIQITDKHVLAFVGGYGTYDYYGRDEAEQPISWGGNETKLQVYTKPTAENPFLTLVGTQSINGWYQKSRYMKETDTLHLFTGVDINTGYLSEALNVFNFGLDLNTTKYYEEGKAQAEETLVPRFVSRLIDQLMQNNQGQLPTVMQLNSWRVAEERRLSSYGYFDYGATDVIGSYIQVLTIDPQALPVDTFVQETLKMNSTVILGPDSSPEVHASGDSIVLSVERFDWNEVTRMTDETVYLLQLKVHNDGPSTSLHAVAAVPGRLSGEYPTDIQGNDLRVAVTLQNYYPVDKVDQKCGSPSSIGASTTTSMHMAVTKSTRERHQEDECLDETSWLMCHDLVMDNCENVTKSGCPYTFECVDDSYGESSTENHVIIFRLDNEEPGILEEQGRVQFGENHEVIRSIHFGETFSYAVTAARGQDGPFYVLNLSEGKSPSVAYKLEPPEMIGGGVMSPTYLQPINEEGSLLVGIGQSITGPSMRTTQSGVAVTIFDVSNTSQPLVLASQMVSKDEDHPYTKTWSLAEYDAKAVEYTDDGLLIIPLTMHPMAHMAEYDDDHSNEADDRPMYKSRGFEGFIVLDVSNVDEDGIQEVFRVNHANPTELCGCGAGFLKNHRSIWYEDDGSLMTMYSHKVASTNMTTLDRNWELNITVDGDSSNCCF